MKTQTLTLIEKIQLTHDVYELVYTTEDLDIQAGQFLLCDCEEGNPKLKRSYSVSWAAQEKVHFIIKRLADGTGGSIAICDQEVGHQMSTMGPLGHFTLKETPQDKVFIGTGTGFAPLYFQILAQLQRQTDAHVRFIFGVREEKDVFYTDILDKLSDTHPNFSYQLCLSRPTKEDENTYTGYVTNCLKDELKQH